MRGLFVELDVFLFGDLFNAVSNPAAGLLDHLQTLIGLGDVPFCHLDDRQGIADMVVDLSTSQTKRAKNVPSIAFSTKRS